MRARAAYGLFARHVTDLKVRDVDFTYDKDERRPVVHLQDVAGADFDHLDAGRPGNPVMFVLRSVRDFVLRNSASLKDVQRERAERESF